LVGDVLAARLQTKWQDALPHYVFERIVMEGYRDALLTTREVQELLGLDTRLVVYELCDKYKITDYTLDDAAHDRNTSRALGL
jgi:hypothetical protein